MTRALDPVLLTEFESSVVAPIFLFEFAFDTAPLRLWSGIGDVVIGGHVYTGAGPLLNLSATQETTQLQALGITVRLNGMDPSIISLALAELYQGRVITVWVSALDTESRQVIGAPYMLFRGRMDVMEINETGESCDITLSCEHMLIDLDKPRLRFYTNADQAIDFPQDRGLEHITALQDAAISWGN